MVENKVENYENYAGNSQADNDNDRLLIWGRNLKLRQIIYTEKSHTHTHTHIHLHTQTDKTNNNNNNNCNYIKQNYYKSKKCKKRKVKTKELNKESVTLYGKPN